MSAAYRPSINYKNEEKRRKTSGVSARGPKKPYYLQKENLTDYERQYLWFTKHQVEQEVDKYNESHYLPITDDISINKVLSASYPCKIVEIRNDGHVPITMTYTSVLDAVLQNTSEKTNPKIVAELESKFTQLKFEQNPYFYEILARIPQKSLEKFYVEINKGIWSNKPGSYRLKDENNGLPPICDGQMLETVKEIRNQTMDTILNTADVYNHSNTITNLLHKNQLTNKISPNLSQADFNYLIIRAYIIASMSPVTKARGLDILNSMEENDTTNQILSLLGYSTKPDNSDPTQVEALEYDLNQQEVIIDGKKYKAPNTLSLISNAFAVANYAHYQKYEVLTKFHKGYPDELIQANRPLPLFVKGNLDNFNTPKMTRMHKPILPNGKSNMGSNYNRPKVLIHMEEKATELGITMIAAINEQSHMPYSSQHTIWTRNSTDNDPHITDKQIDLHRDTIITTSFPVDIRFSSHVDKNLNKQNVYDIDRQIKVDLGNIVTIDDPFILNRLFPKKNRLILEPTALGFHHTAVCFKNCLKIVSERLSKQGKSTPELDKYVRSYANHENYNNNTINYVDEKDPYDLQKQFSTYIPDEINHKLAIQEQQQYQAHLKQKAAARQKHHHEWLQKQDNKQPLKDTSPVPKKPLPPIPGVNPLFPEKASEGQSQDVDKNISKVIHVNLVGDIHIDTINLETPVAKEILKSQNITDTTKEADLKQLVISELEKGMSENNTYADILIAASVESENLIHSDITPPVIKSPDEINTQTIKLENQHSQEVSL